MEKGVSIMKHNPFFPDAIERNSGTRVIGGMEAQQPPPRVFIELEALQTIKLFIDLLGCEINGFGLVERLGNDFIIKQVFILKQYVEGAHALTDPEALNQYVYELVKKDGNAEAMKFQWHSHVDFSANFSPEDVDTIRGYLNDFMISLVMNQAGSYSCRLDLFKPFGLSLEVPLLVIVPPPVSSLADYCRREISEKVIIKRSARVISKSRIKEPGRFFMEVRNVKEGWEK
jgi:hypothetical protein